jgi:hypothetical protein
LRIFVLLAEVKIFLIDLISRMGFRMLGREIDLGPFFFFLANKVLVVFSFDFFLFGALIVIFLDG